VRPSFEAEQQIQDRLPQLRRHFAEPPGAPLWPAVSRILELPHAAAAVRAMHDCGVLGAIFPELDGIECLVVRDFYHRYTVDEHTLVALDKLAAADGPFRDLLAEVRAPAVLRFALLFHDSGKAAGEGHVDAGLRLAEAAARRIGMPPPERDTVLFLIRRHLDLSAAMRSRDLFDPEAIHALAQQVETVERLKALALLTYADISAVNPAAMTPWRAEQLWQLYLMLHAEFTRELESERVEAADSDFLRGLPTRYLRTHTPEEIEMHLALEARRASAPGGVAVDLRRLDAAWQLTLIAGDRPGLFAAAAGTISSFGMNIVRAEAFANSQGLVLDTFAFEDPHRTLDLNPPEVERLRATAERVIAGKLNVRDLLRHRPKPPLPSRKAAFAPRISFDSDASRSATLVEIVAQDRPGLLYDLASAISASGANIEVVLIDTQAHKAIDVFYVTAGGHKLDEQRQAALGEALRKAAG